MSWEVEFLDEARRDMRRLDGAQRVLALKAIRKVRQDPTAEGYGKPLGNKGGTDLAGLFKIKLRKSGIRVVYQLVEVDGVMRIVVVGMRTGDEVYREAARRLGR
ncbi:type II toxin-antitoxin system RelE/ParE family toxin [Adlercreutzia sp. ZJ242]|uniref:type II toxin-antitoxin system RelE family toxin n=1 Tax=Adlercreutzia sp. ZJ242 TaxID=2709409 RepID=UPI0013EB9A92|nr:type II toxin-antitoxin system RelE/ParE family toxin [Adlercreutzia sp. ZJ242]